MKEKKYSLTNVCMRYDGRAIKRNIRKILALMEEAEEGTEEYDMLSDQLLKQYEILKKYKESRFYIEPKIAVTIIAVGGIAFFAVCLDQENPKAIKIAQFVLKLFRFG